MGHVGGRRVWGFDISAAEFPQLKKTRVFGLNRPLESDTLYSPAFKGNKPITNRPIAVKC